uniref:Uncharacterized protein n=1 Tax=Magallana gigas TaxID=29159 RepID=A0A8W8JPY9_MAGGI
MCLSSRFRRLVVSDIGSWRSLSSAGRRERVHYDSSVSDIAGHHGQSSGVLPLTSLNRVEKFGVWLGVMDKPEPCPGTEDLHSMALQVGASTLVVIGTTHVVPWLWRRVKSMIGHGVKRVKDGLQCVKDCWYQAWHIPGDTADDERGVFESTKDGSSKSQYQILHKVYERKRVILFVKQNEDYTQIFAYSPVTKKSVLKSYFPSKPRFGVPGW